MKVFSKKLIPTKRQEVFDTYWKFAFERQEIFFKKLNNHPYPWTQDKILKKHRFTNVYRATDRVSQFLISEVIYGGNFSAKDLLFRILLFKTFNKIKTWRLLEMYTGPISWNNYSYEKYEQALSDLKSKGYTIYSGAYIMASGRSAFGHAFKHRNHLKLLEFMLNDNLDEQIQQVPILEDLVSLLKLYPTVGDFLAYQYAIDINYSELTNFSEMEYVLPGPGAINGIHKCFSDMGDYNQQDVIKFMCDIQEEEFSRLGLPFKTLFGRKLQLIDCQNIFCELDKYARKAHPDVDDKSNRSRIKQVYRMNLEKYALFFPPKWGINHLLG